MIIVTIGRFFTTSLDTLSCSLMEIFRLNKRITSVNILYGKCIVGIVLYCIALFYIAWYNIVLLWRIMWWCLRKNAQKC